MDKKEVSKKEIIKMRCSRKLYFPVYFMIAVLILFLAMINNNGFEISKIGYFSSIAFILLGLKATEIHRLNNRYEINPISVVHTTGYFNKKSKRLDLHAVSDVSLTQSFWQRLLGYGDIEVSIFASEASTTLKNINNPNKFILILEKKAQEAKKIRA